MKGKCVGVVLAVLLTAGLAFANSGTVTSKNMVGFVKLTIPENSITMCSLNFDTDKNLDELFHGQLTGNNTPGSADNILAWDQASSRYVTYWRTPIDEWWKAGESGVTTDTISPGQGFWIITRAGEGTQTVYLLGEVVDEPVTVVFEEGLNLFGPQYSAALGINESLLATIGHGGNTPGSADNILIWDRGTGRYVTYWLTPITEWWKAGESSATTDSMDLGNGFWYIRRTGQGQLSWSEPKPY